MPPSRRPKLNLVTYLEERLGRLRDGDTWPDMPFPVARFLPIRGATCFVTIGLSKKPLHHGRRHIHQELLLASRSRWSNDISALLATIAKEAWNGTQAVRPGQLFGPRGLIVDSSSVVGFCALKPLSFNSSFPLCTYEERPIEILQLVPITLGEGELVRDRGPRALLRLIREHEPDLLDLARPPMCEAVQ